MSSDQRRADIVRGMRMEGQPHAALCKGIDVVRGGPVIYGQVPLRPSSDPLAEAARRMGAVKKKLDEIAAAVARSKRR
jgi:hypothetical protein